MPPAMPFPDQTLPPMSQSAMLNMTLVLIWHHALIECAPLLQISPQPSHCHSLCGSVGPNPRGQAWVEWPRLPDCMLCLLTLHLHHELRPASTSPCWKTSCRQSQHQHILVAVPSSPGCWHWSYLELLPWWRLTVGLRLLTLSPSVSP